MVFWVERGVVGADGDCADGKRLKQRGDERVDLIGVRPVRRVVDVDRRDRRVKDVEVEMDVEPGDTRGDAVDCLHNRAG